MKQEFNYTNFINLFSKYYLDSTIIKKKIKKKIIICFFGEQNKILSKLVKNNKDFKMGKFKKEKIRNRSKFNNNKNLFYKNKKIRLILKKIELQYYLKFNKKIFFNF